MATPFCFPESVSGIPLQSDECLSLMLANEFDHFPAGDDLKRLRNGDLDLGTRQEALLIGWEKGCKMSSSAYGAEKDIVDNSVCSSDNDDIFGDRQLLPRVGDQYQVEIPELMMEYDGLLRRPTDIKFMSDFPNCCTVGLPVPIMWVHGEGEAIKKESLECHGNQNSAVNEHGSVESESSQESQITSNDKDVQFRTEPLGTELEYAEEMGRRLSKLQTVVNSDTMDANFTLREEKETNLDQGNTGCHSLPCLTTDIWKRTLNMIVFSLVYIFLGRIFILSRNLLRLERWDWRYTLQLLWKVL